MSHYFFPAEHHNLPGVVKVNVPGLPKPVYTNRSMAEQLTALIKSRKSEQARTMIEWLGGMDFQS